MKFNELVNNLMPLVNDASDLPCVIWKNGSGWNLDYINLTPDKATAYYEAIQQKDPYVLFIKGEDFLRGSYPFVYDEVLKLRLRAECASMGDNQTEQMNAITDYLEENMGELSPKAAEYIASLDNPLVQLCEINQKWLNEDSYFGSIDLTFIGQIEAEAANKDNTALTAFIYSDNSSFDGYVNFPATDIQIMAAIRADNMDGLKVSNIMCEDIPLLHHYIGYEGNDTTIAELQYIAENILILTPDERKTFSAFLEVQYTDENITAKHVMTALENLGTVHLDTLLKTYEDVGNKWLNAALDACYPAYDKLTTSKGQSERNLVRFVQTLNDYVDIEKYGRNICKENDFYPTSKGMVSVDWSAFFHREDRQIPDDFKLSDKTKSSILRQVENNKAKISQVISPDKQKKKETTIE